jgi:mannose-1-phosphate guanylyltransferase
MIQATVNRLADLVPAERVLILTNQRLVDPIRRQLPQLPAESIVGEPCKRDTAPCIGLAAALVAKDDPDATLVVMPADHVISPREVFRQSIQQAAALVDAQSFGYIERGEPIPGSGQAPVFQVQRFREKPSADVARQYVAAGNFYWNSGIFVWKARTILDALKEYEPEMFGHLAAIAAAIGTPRFADTLAGQFAAISGKSIDYAVMERYDRVAVIEAPYNWDDLGSWRAMARLHGADECGNTRIGRSLSVRTTNSIIRSSDEHLVATIGVDNLIVVHTPDATLVVNQDDEEAVREVVKLLQEQGWQEFL